MAHSTHSERIAYTAHPQQAQHTHTLTGEVASHVALPHRQAHQPVTQDACGCAGRRCSNMHGGRAWEHAGSARVVGCMRIVCVCSFLPLPSFACYTAAPRPPLHIVTANGCDTLASARLQSGWEDGVGQEHVSRQSLSESSAGSSFDSPAGQRNHATTKQACPQVTLRPLL